MTKGRRDPATPRPRDDCDAMLSLLLIDHGSRRAEANLQIEAVAARMALLRPQALIEVAHLDCAEPTIAQGIAALIARGATTIQALPYFLSAGRHTQEDIPALCQAAVASHPGVTVTVAPPLGPDDALVELLLRRAGL